MSRNDDYDFDNVGTVGAGEDDLSAPVHFSTDTGTLPMEVRRVLVRLLLGPSLDARRHEKLWAVLKKNEVLLCSRLSDMFLELVVDDDAGVAFLRQVTSEEVDVTILLRRQSLSFLESVLLLFLRQKLTQGDVHAERAVVDTTEMREYMQAFEKSDNVDSSRFGKQMEAAIEKAKRLGILHKLTDAERFEVSPTLRVLFPVDEIKALGAAYLRMTPNASVGATDAGSLNESPTEQDEAEVATGGKQA